MFSIMQDLRFTIRLMRKRAGSSALVVIALVLGVAVNSAIFAVVNVVLLRPWPFKDAKRLFYIQTKSPAIQGFSVSYPDFQDWKSQSHSFVDMTIARRSNFNVTDRGPASLVAGNMVSSNFFKVLGVPMLAGRDFDEADDRPGANRTAIIGYSMWESLAKDRDIIGKTLVLNDEPYSVIGIAPPSQSVQQTAVWVPISLFLNKELLDRNHRFSRVIARLAPGVSESQAQTEMDGIARRLASDFPLNDAGFGVHIVQLYKFFVGDGWKPFLLVLITAIFVFLMGCMNVATIQMTGILERRKELGVRLALGASRFTLLRQLSIEASLLAGISALVGLVAAQLTTGIIADRYAFLVTSLAETKFDTTVVWFTLSAAILSTFLTYLMPGLYISRFALIPALKGEASFPVVARFRSMGRQALVTFQVSITLALCLSSGLLVKSLHRVVQVDLGYAHPDKILACFMSLPPARYPNQEAVAAFYERLTPALKPVPGVRSVSVISRPPLTGAYNAVPIEFEGSSKQLAADRPVVDVFEVVPEYFSTMQISLIRGRDFSANDRRGTPMVAVVDDVLAANMWPGRNPLEQRIRLADPGDTSAPWLQVIGVVRQVKHYGPEQPVPRMQVYVSLLQERHSAPIVGIVARFDRDESSVRKGIREAVYGLDKELWLNSFETLDWLYHLSEGRRKVSVTLMSSFAVLGVLLATIGISGAVSTAILRRRRELAIRIALGAQRSQATRDLLKWILASAGMGLTIGLILVFALRKLLASFLFGVAVLDGEVYFWAILSVALLSLVASFLPARGILQLDPQDILREG